jgi:hypothetical protein
MLFVHASSDCAVQRFLDADLGCSAACIGVQDPDSRTQCQLWQYYKEGGSNRGT